MSGVYVLVYIYRFKARSIETVAFTLW